MSEQQPNLNFGSPTIFFDSHPDEQEAYLYSYWTALKSTLKTAWTGDVPPFHPTGQLRLIWYTHDGTRGIKDYGLHQYALVRDNFDELLRLEDVRRVVIMGYSGQNPYVLDPWGKNVWADRFDREKKWGQMAVSQEMKEMKETEKEKNERLDNVKEGRTGKVVDIEGVIERSDRAESERRKEDEEKMWKENEGLLSGEMV